MTEANELYIAVYEHEGRVLFAHWGSWGKGKIRWYKSRKEAERQLEAIMSDTDTRTPKPPENTVIVRYIPEGQD